MDFLTLKKNLKKDFSGLKSLKIALLGDSSTQLLHQALKGYGYTLGLDLDVFEADYDQIERQILDPDSELFRFSPEFIVIFHSTPKLVKKYYALSNDAKITFAADWSSKVSELYASLQAHAPCKVIYFNLLEWEDGVFGNFSSKVPVSFNYQIKKLNVELMNLAQAYKDLYIYDLNALQIQLGRKNIFDPKFYVTADMLLTTDCLPLVAAGVTGIIEAIRGVFKKCVILDLDNTIWGGVIGDDGMENLQLGDLGIGKAFTDFQWWLKQLQQRGILLAACSKNDESLAREAFNHPDMVLGPADFAVFLANWENKVDNIRAIQEILNISFDSMVFVDDNPFERHMVKEAIPEITVPEMPKDPAEYLGYLQSLNLFETASLTEGDGIRTLQYQEEAHRQHVKRTFLNEDEFLKSLDMESEIKAFDTFNMPRVVQLIQRSNQFNLRTVRYSPEEIERIARSKDHVGLSFTLRDKFGDSGLISVVILKKEQEAIFIDTWIMSCRVLKRGMEHLVLNELLRLARENGFKKLIGEYLPTKKNGLVKDHYRLLGFASEKDRWIMDVPAAVEKNHFIKRIVE